MTRPIGFSTGALALGDFRAALDMLKNCRATTVELSAPKILVRLCSCAEPVQNTERVAGRCRTAEVHRPRD